MESRKMILMNLFSGQQWRIRHREQTYVHGGRRDVQGRCTEGEGEMYGNSNTEIYKPYIKQTANGNFLCDSGNSNGGSATG